MRCVRAQGWLALPKTKPILARWAVVVVANARRLPNRRISLRRAPCSGARNDFAVKRAPIAPADDAPLENRRSLGTWIRVKNRALRSFLDAVPSLQPVPSSFLDAVPSLQPAPRSFLDAVPSQKLLARAKLADSIRVTSRAQAVLGISRVTRRSHLSSGRSRPRLVAPGTRTARSFDCRSTTVDAFTNA